MEERRIVLGRRGVSTPNRRQGSSRQKYAETGIKLVRDFNIEIDRQYEKKCFEPDEEELAKRTSMTNVESKQTKESIQMMRITRLGSYKTIKEAEQPSPTKRRYKIFSIPKQHQINQNS